MRHFIKTILAVSIILTLHFIKRALSKDSPSYFFWYNFLSAYQILILLIVASSILFELILSKWMHVNKAMLISVALGLGIIAAAELGCIYLLNNPKKIPNNWKDFFSSYYFQFDMRYFQTNPDCSRYDSILFYSMHPSSEFIYANREYRDTFQTNKRGFRGGEDVVDRPDIISLGDSYAMGLGVKQNETYSHLLGQYLGLKVFNASNSSFGTARESLALASIDTSAVQFVIWQYCSNDALENKEFIGNRFAYSPPSPEYYMYLQQLNEANIRYFPGKHSITLLKLVTGSLFRPSSKNTDPSNMIDAKTQAINFLKIISQSPINFRRTKIVLFELDHLQFGNDFTNALQQELKSELFGHLSSNIVIVDMSLVLRKNDYHILDNHINASGHRIIANQLRSILKSLRPDGDR